MVSCERTHFNLWHGSVRLLSPSLFLSRSLSARARALAVSCTSLCLSLFPGPCELCAHCARLAVFRPKCLKIVISTHRDCKSSRGKTLSANARCSRGPPERHNATGALARCYYNFPEEGQLPSPLCWTIQQKGRLESRNSLDLRATC